ncbi:MAG: hypothetical protein Q9195_007891 [Heterodermia aff. obscurata]
MNELVDNFMEKTKLDPMYRETIQKGAFLAQDSNAFALERRDGLVLSKVEREWLAVEDPQTGNKWNQPWILYALIGCCSLGAAVQGWDETAVNGGTTSYIREAQTTIDMIVNIAQLYYKYAFGIGDTGGNEPVILGLVNSAVSYSMKERRELVSRPLNPFFANFSQAIPLLRSSRLLVRVRATDPTTLAA